MSMQLMLIKVSENAGAELKKDAEAFFERFEYGEYPNDFDFSRDADELDYISYEGIAREMFGVDVYEQDTWTAKATGNGFGTPVDYDAGYGEPTWFSISETQAVANGLVAEGWDPRDDHPANVAAFFQKAASEAKAVLCWVQ